ncbi:hypothetical protein GNI_073120 [Gregarina niphandrodes]|uniref:Protein kinase domain-containing protein n=1 Tax=Gregarina niphandrodes TaxID=110365 RepID=A0A023B764_GRENI|nr:hypothetical protein GNI_073120 [Gregarina niphandrodes]EZG67004.1 hypothetical protein GNI_073120 [Gregarina niphandrodes]|eukprot:XP_011130391.1 hypothetical protein GNI_073120 [Gregarina niphandrodes]
MHSLDKINPQAVRLARPHGIHVGEMVFKEKTVLGSGYSGEVKQVEDEGGHNYALKISNDKSIRFILNDSPSANGRTGATLPEASEFERLRKLYHAGVPVPRPYGFQIYANADGIGTTSLLMDLVDGPTLRDWLSAQQGGVTDKISGRSQHPVMTYPDALARIDVAIAVVASLVKLRPWGLFADFKPRNVMIREQKMDKSRYFSASLVDIGGVVMYQDVSTNSHYRRPESLDEDQSVIFFHPIKDRYLIETTCSYLSPEMAILISEYDYWRGRLHNHFFSTQVEDNVTAAEQEVAARIYGESQKKIGRQGRNDQVDPRAVHNYLTARRRFSAVNVLGRFFAIPQLNGGASATAVSALDNNSGVPLHSDIVAVSEKSTVFTMGLVLTELFGGKRTGLTSLTRLRAVNDIFSSEHHNAEFRIVMEWEARNATLGALIGSAVSTRCPNSNETDGRSAVTHKAPTPEHTDISCDCYFDLYRRYAYPSEGILRVPDPHDLHTGMAPPYDVDCAVRVKRLLDSCLRFSPGLRPSLNNLLEELTGLKRYICSKGVVQPKPNRLTPSTSIGSRAASSLR